MSPLSVLVRLAGAFQLNPCIRCCLTGTFAPGSGWQAQGGPAKPSSHGAGAAGVTHSQGGHRQAVALMYLQIRSLKIGCFKGWV